MDEIKNLLDENVVDYLERLKTADSKTSEALIRNVDILMKHREEIENCEERKERLKMEQNKRDDEMLDRRDDILMKEKQNKENRIFRIVEIVVPTVTGILVVVSDVFITAGKFQFEEEHSFTSSVKEGKSKYIFDLFKKKK